MYTYLWVYISVGKHTHFPPSCGKIIQCNFVAYEISIFKLVTIWAIVGTEFMGKSKENSSSETWQKAKWFHYEIGMRYTISNVPTNCLTLLKVVFRRRLHNCSFLCSLISFQFWTFTTPNFQHDILSVHKEQLTHIGKVVPLLTCSSVTPHSWLV